MSGGPVVTRSSKGILALLLLVFLAVPSVSAGVVHQAPSWSVRGTSQPAYPAAALGPTGVTLPATNGTVVANITSGIWTDPVGVVFDSGNGDIYVSNHNSMNISVIAGNNNTVTSTIPVNIRPLELAYDSVNGYVYEADQGSDTVSVINTTTNAVVDVIYVGVGPSGVVFDAATNTIYVSNENDGTVSAIAGADNTVVHTIQAGDWPDDGMALDTENGNIYVADYYSNSVNVISTLTNQSIGNITVGDGPLGVAVNPVNGDIYVGNELSGNVTVIAGTNNTVVGSIQIGGHLKGVAFDSGNGCVYAADTGLGEISQLSSSNFSVLSSTKVGLAPANIAYDSANGYLYVTDQSSNSVTVVNQTVPSPLSIRSFVALPPTLEVNSATTLLVNVTGGLTPYTYAYAGLPPGCATQNLSSLSCTPILAGNYTVRVFVNDSVVQSATATLALTVTLPSGPVISTFVASPNPVVVNHLAYLNVSASGGLGALAYAFTGLPPGCGTANVASLMCIPTTAGTYVIRVFANDTSAQSGSAVVTLRVNSISTPLAISSFQAYPETVLVGQSSIFSVSVTGGSGTISFVYTGLPAGCTTSDVSSLSCTPAASGVFAVQVFVNDTAMESVSATTELAVNNPAPTPITISAFAVTPSPDLLGEVTYLNVSASGGTGTLGFAYAGLPTGCSTFNVAYLPCTPMEDGNFSIRVFVNDSAMQSASATTSLVVYSWSIKPVSASISPTTASLSAGGAETFTVVAICTAACPAGITYAWSLGNSDLGTLSSTTGNSTNFKAGNTAGTEILFVNASLNGKTVSNSVRITISSTPSGSAFPTWILLVVAALVIGLVLAAVVSRQRKQKQLHVAGPSASGGEGNSIDQSSRYAPSPPNSPRSPPMDGGDLRPDPLGDVL